MTLIGLRGQLAQTARAMIEYHQAKIHKSLGLINNQMEVFYTNS